MSDEYLPGMLGKQQCSAPSIDLLTSMLGAMVLAHSLRDSGTKRQLAVLVTFDTLDFSTLDELQVALATSKYST